MKRAESIRQHREECRQVCATLIQRAWKESCILKAQSNLLRLQQLESSASTTISKTWRRFICEYEYENTLIDTIICQRVVRHFLVTKRQLRLEYESAALIQTAYRRHRQTKHTENLVLILSNMDCLKRAENMSAVLIAAFLRRFVCEIHYERLKSGKSHISANTIYFGQEMPLIPCSFADVVLCQSAVRRFLVTKNKVHQMKACKWE